QRLWQALTESAFLERYWDLSIDSEWRAGAPMTWHQHGVTITDPAQVVLDAQSYERLSYTWHTFSPEWAQAWDFDADEVARWRAEARSKVTFELEAVDDSVRLTV